MLKENKLAINEYVAIPLLLSFFFVVVYFLYRYNLSQFFVLGTDSAGFVHLIKAVAESGEMVSPVFSSFYSAIPLLSASPEAYCGSSFRGLYETTNFSTWHPYLISYLMAIPVRFGGVEALQVAAFANALNVGGALAVIWWFLRGKGIRAGASLAFVGAVLLFPAWSGTVTGQFYYDRLYILPCLALVLFGLEGNIERSRWKVLLTLVLFTACVLVSERAAMLSSMLLLGNWVLQGSRRFQKANLLLLVCGLLGAAYFIVYMKFVQNSLYYSGVSPSTIWGNIEASLFPAGHLFWPTMKWLAVIAPMLALAFVVPRNGLIVLAAILPNVIVSVGGAEKTGFTTHYHAGYIPILLGYAAVGYSRLVLQFENYQAQKGDREKGLVYVLGRAGAIGLPGLLLAGGAAGVAWTSTGFDADQLREQAGAYGTIVNAKGSRDALVARGSSFRELVQSIPPSAEVVSPEWSMPALVSNGNRVIDYFPIGIGDRPYVIAMYLDNAQSGRPEVPSYLDERSKQEIAACVQDRLSALYDQSSQVTIGGTRYVVYRKKIKA